MRERLRRFAVAAASAAILFAAGCGSDESGSQVVMKEFDFGFSQADDDRASLEAVPAGQWPQWGGRSARLMVSDETGLPDSFGAGELNSDGSGIDLATTRNVKWVARLGSQTHGNPSVLGGKVFVGTNNLHPRNPRYQGDRGVLMCFNAETGEFLWHLVVSKLRSKRLLRPDNPQLGICSSPTLEGDRAYLTTGRCEVVCLDANGLANGNDGPFQDEGEYVALATRTKPGKQDPDKPDKWVEPERAPEPLTPAPTDADILWRYDLCEHLDIWPHNATASSVLIHGNLLYVNTGNGVDNSHKSHGSPGAPSVVALDKRTGKLVAADDANITPGVFHGQWSSSSLARVGGRTLLLYGGGDGICYAFDAMPVYVPAKRKMVFQLVWTCDANPPEYRFRDGKPLPYNEKQEGPSEIIGTPVCRDDRVYVVIGQDITHGKGKGALTCIDATLAGEAASTCKINTWSGLKLIPYDVTPRAVIWRYTDLCRSTAMPTLYDGMVFVTDFAGDLHCVDAETGKRIWVHPTGSQTMCSALVADGKVYFGNQKGALVVLAASREKKVISETLVRGTICCTPVAVNGVLFVASYRFLYAIENAGTGG